MRYWLSCDELSSWNSIERYASVIRKCMIFVMKFCFFYKQGVLDIASDKTAD